ncbi:hypothetical protein LTR84_007734 [Exophiala bonariae]|uniref:THUMP domain-containing protein n=1 Tax=Exophiala bonariae TaxID=1690606 RepID=A0AAV9NLC1_9EURO|nr:hypothetical protein LTR84_007734 [Exophiala bonariae]
MVEDSERPAKRLKMDQNNTSDTKQPHQNKGKYRPQSGRDGKGKNRQALVISASGIHNNDVGIFVTSDKGQEKKCLQELVDLLGEQFDQSGQAPSNAEDEKPREDLDRDIEADIQAELDSLKPERSTANAPVQKLTCVELDIPCVSFVRFPGGLSASHNPVEIVRTLCATAANKDFQGPRSRYIKRLTPVSLVRKTMANGLESLCDELLPAHFKVEDERSVEGTATDDAGTPQSKGLKFAIRPTIRNNNKIDRDQVIQTVAPKVEILGKGIHKVDLKGYDKLILVDVYRNIIGMSIVGNDFETFKRYNLSEIHSSHFADDKTESSTTQA